MKIISGAHRAKTFRVIIAALILTLTTAIFAACADGGALIKDTVLSEDTTEYDFTAYFGNDDDGVEIEEALSSYAVDTGVKIKPIVAGGNERDIKRKLNSSDPPAVYVLPRETDITAIDEAGQMLDLSPEIRGTSGKGFPWSVEGFGLVCDSRLISELAKSSDTDSKNYTEDMRLASSAEWVRFSSAFEKYIINNTAGSYTLNGHKYSFPKKKGEFLSALNGVYAVAGASQEIIADRLLSLAFAGADTDDLSETVSEDSAVSAGIDSYIKTLDMLTSSLAGRFAPGIRGTDFLNKEKYSEKNATEIFATDRAAFLLTDSEMYLAISELNFAKAEACVILPVKTIGSDAPRKILARGLYTMYVNAALLEDEQQKAIKFVQWYSKYCDTQRNALEKSVRSFYDGGDVLAFDKPAAKLENFARKSYEDKVVREILEDPLWNNEKLTELTSALAFDWDDSKG
jgi:hypothetical protein